MQDLIGAGPTEDQRTPFWRLARGSADTSYLLAAEYSLPQNDIRVRDSLSSRLKHIIETTEKANKSIELFSLTTGTSVVTSIEDQGDDNIVKLCTTNAEASPRLQAWPAVRPFAGSAHKPVVIRSDPAASSSKSLITLYDVSRAKGQPIHINAPSHPLRGDPDAFSLVRLTKRGSLHKVDVGVSEGEGENFGVSWDDEVKDVEAMSLRVFQPPYADQAFVELDLSSVYNHILCLPGLEREQREENADFGGNGGNGHGLEHWNTSMHPVSVKLGTIMPEGSADVYCYACDDGKSDPEIAAHLASFGINVQSLSKTEKTMTELQMEHNLKYDFLLTTEDGHALEPLFGPRLTRLANLGNRFVLLAPHSPDAHTHLSSYIASTIQALFSFHAFHAQPRHDNNDHDHALTSSEPLPASCIECQLRKFADGLLTAQYAVPSGRRAARSRRRMGRGTGGIKRASSPLGAPNTLIAKGVVLTLTYAQGPKGINPWTQVHAPAVASASVVAPATTPTHIMTPSSSFICPDHVRFITSSAAWSPSSQQLKAVTYPTRLPLLAHLY
ncbi:hypothetical protein C0992_000259 [Termitomyces sp. T32_za158]|nr:hypothetical protein C0992_000259 [Termitomyces sp. T32_za158]